MRMRSRSAGVPSIRAASSATMPSARRGESAGGALGEQRQAVVGQHQRGPRAGEHEPVVDQAQRGRVDRLAGVRGAHARVDRLAQRARLLRQPGGGGAGSGSSRAATSQSAASRSPVRHSTLRRQRSRRVLTKSSAGRPPSQYQ